MDCVFVIISRIPAATAVVKNTVAASIDLDGSAGAIVELYANRPRAVPTGDLDSIQSSQADKAWSR